jgi:hypothetical protein
MYMTNWYSFCWSVNYDLSVLICSATIRPQRFFLVCIVCLHTNYTLNYIFCKWIFFICFRFDKEIINTYYTDVGRLRTSVEKHRELYAEIQKQQEVNDIYKKDCIPNNRQSHLRRFLQMYTNELSVIFYRFDCMLDKFVYRISIFTDYIKVYI